MKRSKILALTLVLALAGFPSLGCSTMRWFFADWNVAELGAAHRENTERMIANPEVVDAESQAAGPMDGETAVQTMENYRSAQKQRPRTRGPSIINIGTGAAR